MGMFMGGNEYFGLFQVGFCVSRVVYLGSNLCF